MSLRLSTQTLAEINADQKPNYNRSAVQTGIVHLGIGGFHRAHQAVYTDDLLANGHNSWGITGVSLRSDSVHKLLATQDFLYTVKQAHQQGSRTRIVGSLCDVFALPTAGAREQILSTIADPKTQVVTLTITEKGYCHEPDGSLDTDNLNIVQDLAHPQQPTSAPGLLAQAIHRRMLSDGGPLTVVSCDNLSSNGLVTRSVVEAMIERLHPNTLRWLQDNVSFPSSMVDRIVPQTNIADIEDLQQENGYLDNALVICEPFSQWIVENNFAGVRPPWDLVGARFVKQVLPYEQTKLRFLNATHSALAYLGLLCEHGYIDQAVRDPALRQFVLQLMDNEIEPTVTCPEGFDLAQYKTSIVDRFANTQVRYKTTQVATDGSLKLPQRILPSIQAQQQFGNPAPQLCLVVAAWLECVVSAKARDAEARFDDPLADRLIQLAAQHNQPQGLVGAVAQETNFFGALAQSKETLASVVESLTELRAKGVLHRIKTLATTL